MTISRRPSVLRRVFDGFPHAGRGRLRAGGVDAGAGRVRLVAAQRGVEVRVAAGPKGTMAAWTRLVGAHTPIQARLVARRGSLGAVKTLAQGLDAGFPDVGVAPDGSAVVGWWVDRAAPVVQARRIAPNGKLGPILVVSGGHADSFDLAVGPDGAATFVWVHLPSGDEQFASVMTRRLEPDGRLGPVRELDADTYAAWGPAVAVAESGAAVTAWYRLDDDGAGEVVVTRRIALTGRIEPKRRLWAGRLSYEAPRVAAGSGGRATVVWMTAAEELRARRVDAGAGVGPVLALTKGATGLLGPNVAMGAAGATTVVWGRAAGRGYSVEARRIGRNGGLGPLKTLGSRSARHRLARRRRGRSGRGRRRLAGGRARRRRAQASPRRLARRETDAPGAGPGRPASRRPRRERGADRCVDEPAAGAELGRPLRDRRRGAAKRERPYRGLTPPSPPSSTTTAPTRRPAAATTRACRSFASWSPRSQPALRRARPRRPARAPVGRGHRARRRALRAGRRRTA